jgi:hypothetical protein
MFCSAGCSECSLLRAEVFFCSLDVLYGGLELGKLYFWINKYNFYFQPVNFLNFFVIKALAPDQYSA